MWTLYILQCGDGTLYTGITNHLAQRFAAHCAGKGAKYTRGRGPLQIVYTEACGDHSAALKRECAVKKLSRSEKLSLCRASKKILFPFSENCDIIGYHESMAAMVRPERKSFMQNRTCLMPGVFLQGCQTSRFKSTCLSINILRPLRREEAAKNALISNVLIQGTEQYPDIRSLSLALDKLYGASLGPLIRKNGEIQDWGFAISFLNDRFTMQGEKVLEPSIRLLGEILLHPRLENGCFPADVVELEAENLASTIASNLNDKRNYAYQQMIQAMCKDDGFGVPRLGTEEEVLAITPQELYDHYREALASSPIEIFYAGEAPMEEVAALLKTVLKDLPRKELVSLPYSPMKRRETPQYLEETMEITQGKLCIGLTTGLTTKDPEFPALMVMNTVLGGDLTSKLFQNVREKLSLCYNIGSGIYGSKGIMTISSGIDTENYGAAMDEIQKQLDACKNGDITEEELSASKEALYGSLDTVTDSTAKMEDYTMFQILSGFPMDVADYRKAIQAVTAEDVQKVARMIRMDTVFFLKGGAK